MDDFQKEAIDALNQGYSVVISAPTGSGKTLVGEYSIYRAISHGKKVFYTTPLKALSNQKLRDFREQFGEETVGLMTGDLSLNREASILVMTTEIFRNMLYGEFDENDDPLLDVEVVVLDECHYMNDSQRGTVWEESIIHCPQSIQLVALSATVANAGQLTDWIQKVHGPTQLVQSKFRPVPLHFNFCSAKGLHPLLNAEGTGLHPNCKVWRAPKGNKRKNRSARPPQPDSPSISFVVLQMAKRNMLPAIFFIFSRRGCDKAVKDLTGRCLVDAVEKKLIRKVLQEYIRSNPEAIRDGFHVDALLNGIASHHAGVLPAWKELIEQLFQMGLVKVVFATETLAAGINMPARSTVIASLSKRTESGHRPLLGSEFLQMAGRAGRRGLDLEGYVVTVQSRFEGVREAGQLAVSSAEPLTSQFTPSYGMVLNLLQRYDLHKSKEFIERSFGCYLASLDLVEEEDLIEGFKDQLAQMEGIAGDIPWVEFENYEKECGRLKEERRLLRILQKQAEETLANELTLALQFASIGTLVTLKASQLRGHITPAVIIEKVQGSRKFPLLLCLTSENIWILIPCNSVVGIHAELSCLDVDNLENPSLKFTSEICHGNNQSKVIADVVDSIAKKHDLNTPQYDLAQEVMSQGKLVKSLEKHLFEHPAHKWTDRKKLRKYRKRMEELKIEINTRQKVLHDRSNRHWESFLSLIDILQHFSCLEDLVPTEMGRAVASFRGENELWLGLALMSGHLDELHPAHLASVFEAISVEIKRPDLWTSYCPPPKAEEALNDLSGIRRDILSKQKTNKVDIPVLFEPELMGLVDAWARGSSWSDLISNTSLDEGDVVRILRRSVDLLSQVPHCDLVTEQLRKNARLALKAINRFPVCESEDFLPQIKDFNKTGNPAIERLN